MKNNHVAALLSLCFAFGCAMSSSKAQTPVDVFFIAGQSNAGNIGEQNGTGLTDVGFSLTFGRIADGPNGSDTAPNTVIDAYSSNFLDLNQNVNQLAVALHDQNDLAIYAFGRNGRPLANQSNDGGESWNADAGELYDQFINWANQRMLDLQSGGFAPEIRGVLWFQGEGDVRDASNGTDPTAVANYQGNYENLVSSFRADLAQFGGDDLIVIAADLRIVSNSNQEALNELVRNATANVAAVDSLAGTIDTTDGNGLALPNRFGGANGFDTDVHFSNAAQEIILNRFADEYNRILAAGPMPTPQIVVRYDSVSPASGGSDSALTEIFGETDFDFVTSAADFSIDGGNSGLNIDLAGTLLTAGVFPHPTQNNVTGPFADQTDMQFIFGGFTEALDGPLVDSAEDDGEWVGFSFEAAQNLAITQFDYQLFVNSSGTFAARDSALFARIGSDGPFTQFGVDDDQTGNGNRGNIMFTDNFAVSAGQTVELRLAFTDRTRVELGLPATRTTRIGDVRITAIVDDAVLIGDVNLDGTVDLLDVGPFVTLISSGNFQAEGDINMDGIVDLLDVGPFVDLLSGG